MRTAKFFDDWARLESHLDNPMVLRAKRIFQWWRLCDGDAPLIAYGSSDDEQWVLAKLATVERPSMYEICVPHECVDLNPIILPPLLQVSDVDNDKLFVVTITPIGSLDGHVVLANQYIEPGTMLKLLISIEDTRSEPDIVLYDLIYPLMPFYGRSWERREESLLDVVVKWCESVEDNNSAMGYSKYVD